MTFDNFRARVEETASALGLTEYELYYTEENSRSVSASEGVLQEFSSDVTAGATFRCKNGGKMGYCSTELLSEEEADRIVRSAAENAATLETADETVIFAGSPSYPDTESRETRDASTADMSALAISLYEAALAADPRVQASSQARAAQERYSVRLVNSAGLDLRRSGTLQMAVQSAIIREGTEQYNSSEYVIGSLQETDLQTLAGEAVKKALDKISGAPVPSGSYNIIFENRCFASLLSAFSGIFSAKNAQQGMSLLAGREGDTIAAACVTLTDDPFCGDHQAAFDDEGVATRKKNVIEKGVFQTLLYNLQTAKKAGRESTGNGSRAGYASPVEIAPFNFYLQPGVASAEELYQAASAESLGLLITDLAGLHAGLNPITGDFSLMASGYRLENGCKTTFVNGITVSGNFYTLLKDIRCVAADLDFGFPRGTMRFGSPSVFAGMMSVAGKETA